MVNIKERLVGIIKEALWKPALVGGVLGAGAATITGGDPIKGAAIGAGLGMGGHYAGQHIHVKGMPLNQHVAQLHTKLVNKIRPAEHQLPV